MIIRALAVRSSGLSFFLLVACSGGSKKAGDSVALSASPSAAVTASKPAIDPCPKNGLWAPCSVERRLKQSGFVVTRLDTAARNHAGFTVKPVVLSLGKSKLEVFLYESDADANRDASALDTVAVAPKGQAGAWELPPILIRNANLIAVLLTENARQAERASAALTAGPPQKGSSR